MKPDALEQLASKKGVDAQTVIRALNLAWSSTKCELEGHPVEYGIILGSFNSILSAIPQPCLRGPKLDTCNLVCGKIIQNYGGLDEWNKSALIIDRHTSKIEGCVDLSALRTEDPYEYISGITNSICIITKRTHAVRIYCNGKLEIQYIFNRKSGVIEERKTEEFVPIFTRHDAPPEVATKVLDTCLRISEIRKGASIFLGLLPNYSIFSQAALDILRFYNPEMATTLPMSSMIRYATEDGATWIDERGLVRGYKLTFVGPGGRHVIAKHITSKNKDIVATVVSQDGEIKIFEQDAIHQFATQTARDILFVEDRK